MHLTRRFVVICCAFMLLSACAALRPEPPEVQLAGLEITDLSLSHANFQANMRLYNPNNMTLDINGLAFTLFLNDLRVAQGKTAKRFSLPAEGVSEASLHLSSSFLNLLQLSTGLQGKDRITFRIAGEVEVGGMGFINMTIPIDSEGSLPLTGSLQQLRAAPQGRTDDLFHLPGQDLLLRQ